MPPESNFATQQFRPTVPEPVEDLHDPRIDDALIEELATLSPIEYERRREEAAAELSIRVSTLDQEVDRRRPRPDADGSGSAILFEEYEPWPEPVDGCELLARLQSAISRYAIMPPGSELATALWVLFAHSHNYHPVSPILAILAPDSECGKSTVLNTVSWLVPKALPSSGASPATVYRVIEECQPTLLTDELDSLPRETADALRGIYNSGHIRRLAYIMRMVPAGDNMEVRRFSTWAPKAIAQIGKPATTILSRSLVIWMQRKKPDEYIEKLPIDGTAELVELHRMCLRWATDHGSQLMNAAPELPSGMANRLADNWTPLFAIADLIGGPWPEQARDAAEKLSGVGKDDTSRGIQVLGDIRELFNERAINRIGSQELCDALREHDDKWEDYSRGKPLSPAQLSRLLKPYGVRSKSLRLGEGRNSKGYEVKSFSGAFDSYLSPAPPSGNVTPSQPTASAGYSDSQAVTSPSNVTDGNGRKPAATNVCDAVPEENLESPRKGIPDSDETQVWTA